MEINGIHFRSGENAGFEASRDSDITSKYILVEISSRRGPLNKYQQFDTILEALMWILVPHTAQGLGQGMGFH